jgi:hypothetical protein
MTIEEDPKTREDSEDQESSKELSFGPCRRQPRGFGAAKKGPAEETVVYSRDRLPTYDNARMVEATLQGLRSRLDHTWRSRRLLAQRSV